MKPTKNSPKNKFRASITYSKPLKEIGSVSTALGMTLEEVKNNALFYTDQAKKNQSSFLVVIYENIKQYPEFDWVEVERFDAEETTINNVKKILGLTQNDIAEIFGYKDGGSYARSTRKHHVDNGIIQIYLRTKKALEKNIKTVDLEQTNDEKTQD